MAAEQVEVNQVSDLTGAVSGAARLAPWRRGWRVSQGTGGDAAQWPAADTL